MKIACACLAGREHQKKNIECQDMVRRYRIGEKELLVLADGAGSKPLARESAELVIQKTVEYFSAPEHTEIGVFPKEAFVAWINQSFHEAGYSKDKAGTTLQFFYSDGRDFLLGHLGDGLVLKGHGKEIQAVFLPKNGEFVNQTVLFPGDEAEKNFSILKGELYKYEIFIFMSDGIEHLLYNEATYKIAPACEIIANWAENKTEEELQNILEDNLRAVFSDKTSDDISIGVVYID